VFVGHAVVTLPPDGDHPVGTQDGYETLVWVRAGERWQIAHWQWVRAGLDAERDKWNDYFKNSHGYNLKPNQLLVDTVKGKKPGTALDVAMGQGRNAIFLASQGWKVTGVDISDEGMRIAKDAAAAQKLKLDTVNADLEKYDFGKDRWDLVTLIYAGDNVDEVKRILPSLKKGGLFVCEYFHADSDAAKSGAGGWATGKLAELFKDGFKIIRDDVVEDNADWAGQRKTKLVRFVAQKL
jgi:ubiquinone/menaquinone biosynthesis C-methylase UbiE